jgi:hypothetical protein
MAKKRIASEERSAAVGFRAHSGWTAFVVVANAAPTGTARSPIVLDRGRIELVETQARWFKQPYHAAAGMDMKDAEDFLKRCASASQLLARRAIRELRNGLRKKGHALAACGIVLGSGRPLPPLASTLKSHALIHTAEGILFREALARASKACKLPVCGVAERELYRRAAAELRSTEAVLRKRLAEMGKAVGPPWRADEKNAALVAWMALAGGAHR